MTNATKSSLDEESRSTHGTIPAIRAVDACSPSLPSSSTTELPILQQQQQQQQQQQFQKQEEHQQRRCHLLPLTQRNLLDICTLPTAAAKIKNEKNQSSSPATAKEDEKQHRLETLLEWKKDSPKLLQTLLYSKQAETAAIDPKSGCYPLHWAAGTGFNQGVRFILDYYFEIIRSCCDDDISTERMSRQDTVDEKDVNCDGHVCYSSHHNIHDNGGSTIVNQRAYLPSLGRTPLHYAARNGYKSTCQLLIEVYGANPNPKCQKGSVTPLQLAVWQNHLQVVQYLIHMANTHNTIQNCDKSDGRCNVIFEKNNFQCGLMHWIGLVPQKRWCGNNNDVDNIEDPNVSNKLPFLSQHDGQEAIESHHSTQPQQEQLTDEEDLTIRESIIDKNESHNAADTRSDMNDGSGVLPLAKYLHSLGVSYASTPCNANSQGHVPLHKAAYGGNLRLVQYFIQYHHVYDNKQDTCGNYGTDLARMQGHTHIQHYLWHHGSYETYQSYQILGFVPPRKHSTIMPTITKEDIKRRYTSLIRQCHPDKRQQQNRRNNNNNADDTSDIEEGEVSSSTTGSNDNFLAIQEAYDHLMKRDGIGSQTNPKHSEWKLLTMEGEMKNRRRIEPKTHNSDSNNKEEEEPSFDDDNFDGDDDNDGDALFNARLLTVISDYGEKGFPISNISKRWNQIWPNKPFPTPNNYIIETQVICNQTKEVTTIQKKVKLLKFLKWKCRHQRFKFRKVNGVILAYKI